MGSAPVLLTTDGLAVSALSPQESLHYPSLFKLALGPKANPLENKIPASKAALFLKRSGLTKKQLHDIWRLSDPTDTGCLNAEGFFKACRLVAHAQCGSSVITPDLLSQEPPALPFFDGAESGADAVWKLSDNEIKTYSDIYRKEGGTTKLDGTDARSLLLRSGLSNSELCDIWDLADVDKDGKLTFGEFLVAMGLVSRLRDGKAFMPSSLPQPLKDLLGMTANSTHPEPFSLPPPASSPRAGVPPVDTTIGFGKPENVPTVSPSFNIGFGMHENVPTLSPKASGPTLLEKELMHEQKELSQSILTSRQLRKQVADGRSRLTSLREEAKKVEIDLVSADHDVERMQDQILSLQQQIAEAEEDLEMFRREAGLVSLTEDSNDVALAVEKIRISTAQDEQEVLELRAQIERVHREKVDLQASMAVQQEKKRQAERDRDLMLAGLEQERAKLVALRAERLKLWEQRHQLTRELTTTAFDQLNASMKQFPSSGVLPSATDLFSPKRQGQARDRKGVRSDSTAAAESRGDLKKWSQFGTGQPFQDPVAGAFGKAPTFGSI